MYGLRVGRSVLESRGDGRPPIVYYSEDTHFSVRKIVDPLRLETELALHMLDRADYAMKVLARAGYYAPRKNEFVFERPLQWIVDKWSLSTMEDLAHIFAMGHISKSKLDHLAADLRSVREVAVADWCDEASDV